MVHHRILATDYPPHRTCASVCTSDPAEMIGQGNQEQAIVLALAQIFPLTSLQLLVFLEGYVTKARTQARASTSEASKAMRDFRSSNDASHT